MVRAGLHKASGCPVAIKIINLFDKDKRHQFYNEFDMIQSFCPVLVSSDLLLSFDFNRSDIMESSTMRDRSTL